MLEKYAKILYSRFIVRVSFKLISIRNREGWRLDKNEDKDF